MEFKGYRRDNGKVGTRNYIGVISTVVCANEVAEKISSQVLGAVPFLHQQGCCQTPLDINRVTNVLIGLGRNPNLASVLLISLGCESVELGAVVEGISQTGKMQSRDQWLCNTGGFMKLLSDGSIPSWGEKRGFRLAKLGGLVLELRPSVSEWVDIKVVT